MKLTLMPYQITQDFITLKIQAADDGGSAEGGVDTSAVQMLEVSVVFVNSPPTFNLVSNVLQVREGTAYSDVYIVNISSGAGNEEVEANQDVTFSIQRRTDVEELFLTAPIVHFDGTLSFEILPNAFGQATFDVSAQDSGGTALGGWIHHNYRRLQLMSGL